MRIRNQLVRRIALLTTSYSLLTFLLACNSSPAPQTAAPAKPAAPSITYPARPATPPAPFKLFHHYDGNFTLTVADKATDDQIAALVWQLRDAARTHTFDHIHIPQKDIDAAGTSTWFHIYRGTKCAPEKYAPGHPPCGASYHASADYTFSKVNNQPWDKGTLLHDEKESPLWNPEAPYTPPVAP